MHAPGWLVGRFLTSIIGGAGEWQGGVGRRGMVGGGGKGVLKFFLFLL